MSIKPKTIYHIIILIGGLASCLAPLTNAQAQDTQQDAQQKKPGLDDPERLRALIESAESKLDLSHLKTLDLNTAQLLAKFKGEMLFLNGVTQLSPEHAKLIISAPINLLRLEGLTSLSQELASTLAQV